MAATVTIASGAIWQEVAADRQKHRDATISAIAPALPDLKDIPLNTIGIAKKVLTAEEIKITESLVEDLAALLAREDISAVTVVKAFLRRAGLAQKAVSAPIPDFPLHLLTPRQTNCITELLPTKALERAKYLDEYFKENGKPIGPLHGIPISVKEHVGMKELDLNGGFVSWVGTVAQKDAHILEILWNAGAVFYARTTQPQTLMHLETSTNLYG